MSYIDGPRGIGGWLTLFLVVVGLISPLNSIASTYGTLYGDRQVEVFYGPFWPRIELAEWTIVALTALGCWAIVGRMMFVFRWSSVIFAIVGIWCVGVLSNFLEMLVVSWIAGLPLSRIIGGVGADLIRPFAFGGVWTAYLLRSERVANTYPRHSDGESVSEVFE